MDGDGKEPEPVPLHEWHPPSATEMELSFQAEIRAAGLWAAKRAAMYESKGIESGEKDK
jgi:hypothetical protein